MECSTSPLSFLCSALSCDRMLLPSSLLPLPFSVLSRAQLNFTVTGWTCHGENVLLKTKNTSFGTHVRTLQERHYSRILERLYIVVRSHLAPVNHTDH